MQEIWRASSDPRGDWKKAAGSSLIGWWWALFILSALLGDVFSKAAESAKAIDELLSVTQFHAALALVLIGQSFLFLRLLRKIATMQLASHDKS